MGEGCGHGLGLREVVSGVSCLVTILDMMSKSASLFFGYAKNPAGAGNCQGLVGASGFVNPEVIELTTHPSRHSSRGKGGKNSIFSRLEGFQGPELPHTGLDLFCR